MLIPVRCFTCCRPVGHLWETYQELLKKYGDTNEGRKKALDELGLDPEIYCCRQMLSAHVEIADTLLQFEQTTTEQ